MNKTAFVTAGATREYLDPVRYITNESSGKQGYAIAEALASKGYITTLVTGATNLPDPDGVTVIKVTSALQMLKQCKTLCPADIAICSAAVSDWRPAKYSNSKIKKTEDIDQINIKMVKNPDILHYLSTCSNRPKIVVGFAAETNNLIQNAQKKLQNKQCNVIVANKIYQDDKVFGSDFNEVSIITDKTTQNWGKLTKQQVAERLISEILNF